MISYIITQAYWGIVRLTWKLQTPKDMYSNMVNTRIAQLYIKELHVLMIFGCIRISLV